MANNSVTNYGISNLFLLALLVTMSLLQFSPNSGYLEKFNINSRAPDYSLFVHIEIIYTSAPRRDGLTIKSTGQ